MQISSSTSLVLAIVLSSTAGSVAQDRLYFTEYKYNDPTLQSMNLDGTDVQDLFLPQYPFPPGDWLPLGLAVDDVNNQIYWMHGSTPGRIGRAHLDGSGQTHVVTGLKIPRGVALDLTAGKLYWAESPPEGNAKGWIRRANLDGSNIELVYAVDPYDPIASKVGRPTVDAVNGYVYFGVNGAIVRVNLDGPPFNPQTIVTGGSTITRIALDTANNCLYWIDSDTITDCIIRCSLDNSNFLVLNDLTPDYGGSAGLIDLAIDLVGQRLYWGDEIRTDGTKTIERMKLDGSDQELIYTSPSGWSVSGLTLSTNQPQAMLDCNDNGVRDYDDIADGTSADCNNNGIPDECEVDPCVTPTYLLNQSSDLSSPGKQLGGEPENQSWIVFQPFDVPAGGWDVGLIELNGVTWNYNAAGFTATIFPDRGDNYPDESLPLASGNGVFRFDTVWESVPISVHLEEGRHWARLTANADNVYLATVSLVSTGLPSMSRSGLGNDFPGGSPIALRILPADDGLRGDLDCDGDVDFDDISPFVLALGGEAGYLAAYPDCEWLHADCNEDGTVDFDDIGPFIALIGG